MSSYPQSNEPERAEGSAHPLLQHHADPSVRPPVNTTSTPPQPGKSPALRARQFTPGSAGRQNTSG